MKTIAQDTRPAFDAGLSPASALPPVAPRFDLYTGIHKAIRVGCAETLTRLGAVDADDDDEVQTMTGALVAFLAQMRSHVMHENRFVHPAMEARRPGSASQVAGEHEEHLAAIEALEREAFALAATPAALRREPALRLYRHFALFVAENHQHMHHEETVHNAVLWSAYSDAELLAIELAIIGSQSQQSMAGWLHWFAPALATAELAPVLAGARGGMPADVFETLLSSMAARQSPERHGKVRAAVEAIAAAQAAA
ncbi:MAG: hemerythrin domain-containing protein [Burkholderiales bacterium]|nr:hemerythrin domain-containing protein [Burkholderiales bacterium]